MCTVYDIRTACAVRDVWTAGVACAVRTVCTLCCTYCLYFVLYVPFVLCVLFVLCAVCAVHAVRAVCTVCVWFIHHTVVTIVWFSPHSSYKFSDWPYIHNCYKACPRTRMGNLGKQLNTC